MKTQFLGLFICFSLSLLSCQKWNRNSCDGAICTMMFYSVGVKIVDSNDNSILVDRVETYYKNKLIHEETYTTINSFESYTIIDDSDMSDLPLNERVNVQFKAYKNNVLLGEQYFSVSADCCHVNGYEIQKMIID
ncbi:MAG: hypothetical protein R2831_03785 [Chitinophagaceae bacterium]